MEKNLHIVSFDVPYPPNYGGVIDVFYKLKALKEIGYNIYLHTYEYGKGEQKELEKYCTEVNYYKRSKSPLNLLSSKPFIVKSRSNSELVKKLITQKYPILFEGLHTTYPLTEYNFDNRIVLVRSHNIEHRYYTGLAKSETSIARKSFFKQEAKKLKSYEKILTKANYILTISPYEHYYFVNKYQEKAKYIPVFHKNNEVKKLSEKGDFALYHGDLRVSDNIKACNLLITVFEGLKQHLIIASSYIHKELENKINNYANISFKRLEKPNDLDELFCKTQVNVLPTFQKTGIKLKLIHALFESRFCIVNSAMVEDTGLEYLCEIADNVAEFRKKIQLCFEKEYTDKEINKRKDALKLFDNHTNAKKIDNLIG